MRLSLSQLKNSLLGWSIVVVEDDAASRDVMIRTLQHVGATVHATVNGRAGYELVREVHPHLVITDLAMPELNGWDLFRMLRADHLTTHIPLIMVSADFSAHTNDSTSESPVLAYLHKPISPAQFVVEILKSLHIDTGLQVAVS